MCRIVAFSGVDGSGKTTQAKLLALAFEQRSGQGSVAYSHGNRPLFHSDTKGGDGARYREHRRSMLLSWAVLIKDILKLWTFLLRHRAQRVIVFDRFLDDALAKFRFYYQPSLGIERLMRWLAPRANIVIWLDVPPRVSFERDREYPVTYHEKKQKVYTDLLSRQTDEQRLRIDATMSIEAIQEHIQSELRKRGWL